MKKFSKVAGSLLVAAMVGQTVCPMVVQAAEPVVSVSERPDGYVENKCINSVSITGMEEPKLGEVLSTTAVVVADNGASWKIPVVWLDENGKVCKVAKQNVKAYPVFSFYIPKGYVLKGDGKTGVDVNLPEFVRNIFGENELVIINDPSTGLIYITGADGAGKNVTAERVGTGETAVPSVAKVSEQKATEEPIITEEQKVTDNQATGNQAVSENTNSVEAPQQIQAAEVQDDNGKSKLNAEQLRLVEMHCDKNCIEKLGYEKMAVLAELVRYTVQPQAVNMLVNSFDCYKQALESNELGKTIGLYFYYDNALTPSIDQNTGEVNIKYEKVDDAVAYVHSIEVVGGKNEERNELIYPGGIKYMVGVNSSSLDPYMYQDDSGDWVLSDTGRAFLDNTLTHEMMHGFMDDYNRTGMLGYYYDSKRGSTYGDQYKEIHYPKWFVEGTATSVENAYQYWNNTFKKWYGYSGTLDESGQLKTYTKEDLVEQYNNASSLIQLYECENEDGKGRGAYSSGYLACMYLAKMVTENPAMREKYGIDGQAYENFINENGEAVYHIESSVLKQGLDIILKEMHGAYNDKNEWDYKSLDDIIAQCSPLGEDGKPIYENTDGFTDKFIVNDDGAAVFCADLLRYLEAFSTEDAKANGSVLTDFSNTAKSLLPDEKTEGIAYVIQDTPEGVPVNYVESTVSANDAYTTAGKGYTAYYDNTEPENAEVVQNAENTEEENLPAAAKPEQD